MAEPLVSILVPARDAAPWIAETLECALGQTWDRKEIIVVDDGSSDDTLAIAKRFTGRGVTVLSQARSGAGAARNRALAASKGDLLQYLDADDLLSPGKIAAQVPLLEGASNSFDLATCSWGRFDEDLSSIKMAPQFDTDVIEPLDYLVPYLAGMRMYPLHAWLIPRPLAEAVGDWNEQAVVHQDTEYMFRTIVRCSKIRIARREMAYYRTGRYPSVSRRRDRAAVECGLEVIDECVRSLLEIEDSARTRRAAADSYQNLYNRFFGDHRDLLRVIEQRSTAYGGFRAERTGGPRAQAIAKLFGVRALYMIKMIRRRLPGA